MKKVISILVCITFILSVAVFNTAALDFDMDVSEYDERGTAYTIPELDGKYKTQGRTSVINDILMIDHSASGIEFTAKCKGNLYISFVVSSLATGDDGGCYFTVIIDGVKQARDFCHITNSGETVFHLASDLRYGEHTFKIYRQTEITNGVVGIKSITLDGRLLDINNEDKLYIEFVGDSITTAYGNLVLNENVDSSLAGKPLYQDATQGYAYLTAKALDADFSLIAQGGIGASVGWRSYTMQDMYTKLRYVNDKDTDYSFERQADVVVLALGTNDMDTYLANGLTTDKVKQGFANMLALVKQKNPNAAIVWIYNMMRSDGNDLITSVIEEAGGKENGYYSLKLTQNREGGNSHPYYTAHTTMAAELTEFIEQNVFWDNRTADFAEFKGNSIRAKSEKGEQGLRFKYNVNTDKTDVYEKIVENGYIIEEIGVLAIRTRYLNDEALVKGGVYVNDKSASSGVLYNKAAGYNVISALGTGSAVLINIGYNTKKQTLDYNAYSDDYTTRLYLKLKNGERSITVYDEEETASVFEVMQEIIKLSDAENPSEQATSDRQSVDALLQTTAVDKYGQTISELYSKYQIPAETWLSYELSFTSSKEYTATVYTTNTDVIFFNQTTGTTFTVPAFWNGGTEWKARFALSEEGDWRYVTKCDDTSNKGLHYVTGSVLCSEYTGDLDIYKHGFLTTQEGKKYITYADGTPFFYLGDTHWTLPMESLTDANGGLTDDEITALKTEYSAHDTSELGTKSQFEYIMDYRESQGFTVIQSQQLDDSGYGSWMTDAKGNIFDHGIDDFILNRFNTLDKYFAYIAEKGFVHSHSQFAYPSQLISEYFHFRSITDEQIEKLCRYWVARYSSYPVIWATAQEADDDFYAYHKDCNSCNVDSNPWVIVMDCIADYDPYNQLNTAHMQSSMKATESAFDDSENYDFYAAQIQGISVESDDGGISDSEFGRIRTYWENEYSKPSVNYEGGYDNYWASTLRARAQGWMAYLNGMFGYGYGVQPIWSFTWAKSSTDSHYNPDMNWVDGVYAEAAEGMSLMKKFLTETLKDTYGVNWWDMVPSFNGSDYYTAPISDRKYAISTIDADGNASNGADVLIGYFAGTEKVNLGDFTISSGKTYKYEWYDCRTGNLVKTYTVNSYSGESTKPVVSDPWLNLGSRYPDVKPNAENAVSGDSNYNDMLLVVTPK